LGPADSVEVHNLREALAAARKGKRVVVGRASGSQTSVLPKIVDNLRYLDAAVLLALWEQWQLPELFNELLPQGGADVAHTSVVAALTLQRCLDPGSKLYATRWFPDSALPELLHIPRTAFNNTRLHRVLDDLDAAQLTLMGKLPARYQHGDGAFVSLFLDATDTWFVGHGPEIAERAKTKEGRVERKIGIVLLCNQLGYPLRWEVIPGRESEVTAMSRMTGLVAGLSWAQKVPLVCDRAMGRTAQIRQMLTAGLHFLTALTTPEYDAYTNQIPHKALADFKLHENAEQQDIDCAAQLVEKAGLQRVDDRLFVRDLGVVQRVDQHSVEQPVRTVEADAVARVMLMARSIKEAITAGRYANQSNAGCALGLSKALVSRYCTLCQLPESVQLQILDGKARGRSLKELLDIAHLDDEQQQHESFARLVASPAPKRASARPLGVAVGPSAPTAAPTPVRVRAVLYFNPQIFVDQRKRASDQLEAIAEYANDLNENLASSQARMSRNQVAAAIDRRLRKDDLLELFTSSIDEEQITGRTRYQVKLTLNESEWARRHRYDGFSVVVAHPDLQRSATELAQLYRAKDTVEKDFQIIKSLVELRPIRHQTDGKVRAHVTICMLALLLERTLRQKLNGKHSAEAALEILKGCRLNRLAVGTDGMSAYTLTEPKPEQKAILRLLGLQHLVDQDQVDARITPQ
jgi:hypothetical protein